MIKKQMCVKRTARISKRIIITKMVGEMTPTAQNIWHTSVTAQFPRGPRGKFPPLGQFRDSSDLITVSEVFPEV